MATTTPRRHGLRETSDVQFFKTDAAKKTAAKRRSLGAGPAPAAKKAPAKKTGAAKKAVATKVATKVVPEAAAASKLSDKLRGAKAKASAKAPKPKGLLTRGNPRQLLLVEFVLCFVVLGAGTMVAPQGSSDGVPRMAVKGTGLAALFLILSLVASGGKGSARIAAGFGGLVTLAYVFASSDAANLVKFVSGFYSPAGLSGQQVAGGIGQGLGAGAGALGHLGQGGPGGSTTVVAPPAPGSGVSA